jgi:phosphate:Na+ symporter
MGFALFFIGVAQLRATAQVLVTPERLGFLQSWTEFGFGSVMLFLFIGIVLTVCFQSSAATMAIIMILITTGVIPFKMAAAMILGENIGTTIAANIAATVGNLAAKRTAISHTVMNTFGVFWVLCIFPLFLKLVGGIVSAFGLPDPNTADLTDSANSAAITTSLLYSVCTMHTLFNIANTSILVWFIPTIVKIVKWIYPDKEGEAEVFRLKYISGGPLPTAELSLEEANKEIVDFGRICRKGFGYVRKAVNETDDAKFEEYREKLVKYEEITDRIEHEIASYLNEVSRNELSERSSRRLKGMYRIIGEMESVGDSGESISRTLQRARAHSRKFDTAMIERIDSMVDKVEAAFQAMQDNLAAPYGSLTDISNASSAEAAVNECRNALREEHISKMEKDPDYSYQTGVFYMDIVADLEKIGDFIINISEAKAKE